MQTKAKEKEHEMMTNAQANKIIFERADEASRLAESEWGSDQQVAAESEAYDVSAKHYGIDWEEHPYLLHATTEEAMTHVKDYVRNLPLLEPINIRQKLDAEATRQDS